MKKYFELFCGIIAFGAIGVLLAFWFISCALA